MTTTRQPIIYRFPVVMSVLSEVAGDLLFFCRLQIIMAACVSVFVGAVEHVGDPLNKELLDPPDPRLV